VHSAHTNVSWHVAGMHLCPYKTCETQMRSGRVTCEHRSLPAHMHTQHTGSGKTTCTQTHTHARAAEHMCVVSEEDAHLNRIQFPSVVG
jgi:hypothetical protein